MTLIDISPPVSAQTPIWPGDTPYRMWPHWPRSETSPVVVNSINTTLHIGAHADAPAHVNADGATVEQVPLEAYVGPCTVLHILPATADGAGHPHPISVAQVEDALLRTGLELNPRLLLRTYRYHPAQMDESLPGVDATLPAWFAARGGILMGVDQSSFDPVTSKTMDAHRAASAHGQVLLENLLLTHVPEGTYELIALPLHLVGADASPVRAVLRSWPTSTHPS